VLTGEDALYFTMMCNGADGGILAAAHLATERFVEIARLIAANDHVAARKLWSSLQGFVPKLFQEANPMPIKHCLWRQGLIASPECRLPLSSISDGLAQELDHWLAKATTEPR
jgi:4-hydroxy-tetrahydrodipicolinate synthase